VALFRILRKRSTDDPTQVAVVPYRGGADALEICLIRRRTAKKWGIPKGFVDDGDTPEEAGLTEALEEAGLTGRIAGDPIGTYEYEKWGRALTVRVYLMEVRAARREWREKKLRQRRWRSLEDAGRLLADHPVSRLWHRVTARLNN
jgi:8-oxo-dGTP pyrophosphatase MutT (NUDIX family)